MPIRKVYEVSTSTLLEQQIANLTSIVQQLAMDGTTHQVMRCGICSKKGILLIHAQHCIKMVAMSKLTLWEDLRVNRVSNESMIPTRILTIQDGETIQISVIGGINKHRGLAQTQSSSRVFPTKATTSLSASTSTAEFRTLSR